MSPEPTRLFRSSGSRGYSSELADHPDQVSARKYQREVQVRFADNECIIATPEGNVHAKAGDAILTGIAGEHWRVSRAHFNDKYQPVAPTRAGEAGTYLSLPCRIRAIKMNEPFDVLLADKVSRLRGRKGDWLIDYGDGSLGIITDTIFDVTYEIVD